MRVYFEALVRDQESLTKQSLKIFLSIKRGVLQLTWIIEYNALKKS